MKAKQAQEEEAEGEGEEEEEEEEGSGTQRPTPAQSNSGLPQAEELQAEVVFGRLISIREAWRGEEERGKSRRGCGREWTEE